MIKEVPGFPKLRPSEASGGALSFILGKLRGFGYSTTFTLYNTANFGVPQARERIIFFASRDGMEIPLMVPTHDAEGRNGLPRWLTVRHAIGDMDSGNQTLGQFSGEQTPLLPTLAGRSKLEEPAAATSTRSNGGQLAIWWWEDWLLPETRMGQAISDSCNSSKYESDRPLPPHPTSATIRRRVRSDTNLSIGLQICR